MTGWGWLRRKKGRVALERPGRPQILRKGDFVVCENGHVICEINADVALGDINYAHAFVNWQQTERPVPGETYTAETMPRCAHCGEAFIRIAESGGWQVHIRGWR